MEKKKSLSYEEKTKIKRTALEKLDLLIKAELDRLRSISDNEKSLSLFEIHFEDDHFTEDEIKEIKRNIDQLNNNDVKEKVKDIKRTLKIRGL